MLNAGQGGRVVGRCVAERAHDDGVVGQLGGDAQAPGAGQREGEAHRLGQVRLAMVEVWGGTHSGRLPHTLWRPWAIGSSLDATTPSRASKAGVLPGQLAGARHHQRARAVVQEGGVVDPQLRAEHRVVLVARAADRVEAAVRLLQLARRDVDLPAEELVLEQLDRLVRGQAASGTQGIVGLKGRWGGCQSGEEGIERILDHADPVKGHGRR